ncbi:MAG: F0F1 ATP synthase subunit delta [Lactobacillales bacterium]|jgi:F-type H+-transporting ATPase subunit delta|nr:F0F1 ATP synthase subunit delta [Lactobacillales bacterium]
MKLDKFTIGKRYGKALFELTEEKGTSSSVYEELLQVREVFQGVPELGAVLTDSRLSPDKKKGIFKELSSGYSEIVQNFLGVTFDTGRMIDLPFIIDDFEERYDEKMGIVRGTVTTAVPLTNEQKNQIAVGLAQRLAVKTVDLEEKVDKEIVGGVIVEANHQIIDGSIKSQLTKLRNLLKQ